ncbi:helix-turn-helix domain-containing protein [Vibrio gangliei]|uniref:helix-turn-helix domain-containing protein n=1 Tax=Vibrio gangliei TaxID=2077090 RepID=UPI000D017CD1|nr:helix-turn-helix transcriptional regulator [Vibrio gangliei]
MKLSVLRSKEYVERVYKEQRSIEKAAKYSGVAYPTFWRWLKHYGIETNNVGYTPVESEFTGSECRDLRRKAGLTIDQLSEQSGVNRTSIINFELGKATIRKKTIINLQASLNGLLPFNSNA